MTLVSAVIPAFNAAPFLADAIRSLLSQSRGPLEVIVIDDGSVDETAEIAASFGPPVFCTTQKNRGMAASRNAGIAQARGKWIGFLDADDTWMPSKIEKQLATLDAQPSRRVCYSKWLVVNSQLQPLLEQGTPPSGRAIEDLLFTGNVVGSVCTGLVDAELLRSIGGFDESLSHCADWDLWIRLARKTEFAYVSEALVTYRQHGANLSRQVPTLEKDSIKTLSKAFADAETPAELRKRAPAAMARNWMVLAGAYFQAGDWRQFVRCAGAAVAMNPAVATHILMFPWRRLTGRSDWRRQFQ
jgi:glycosyltransferase involved in cell wall biosynthesis